MPYFMHLSQIGSEILSLKCRHTLAFYAVYKMLFLAANIQIIKLLLVLHINTHVLSIASNSNFGFPTGITACQRCENVPFLTMSDFLSLVVASLDQL